MNINISILSCKNTQRPYCHDDILHLILVSNNFKITELVHAPDIYIFFVNIIHQHH